MFLRPSIGWHLLLACVLATSLMILDQHVHTFSRVRHALTIFVAPLQYLVDWPISLTARVGQQWASEQQLLQQNADLKVENLLLKSRVQKLITLQNENSQLRALLLSSSLVQGKVLVAELLSVASDPAVQQFMLNKGQRANLFEGQPVLDANGIVGQIIEVEPLASRVLTITDQQSILPVQDARNGLRALAYGNGRRGDLSIRDVPMTSDVRVGDKFFTSGLAQHYPYGYPVGVVTSVKRQPGERFAEITLEPSAKLNQSRMFLLLWPPRKGHWAMQPIQEVKHA